MDAALVSVNEKRELEAQKQFYDNIAAEMGQKRSRQLNFWQRVNLVYAPILALGFVLLYWGAGLKHANLI